MAIPADVKRKEVRSVQFPLAPDGCGGVAVLKIVGLYVYGCVPSAGAVDAFAIDAAGGVEFEIACRREAESLRKLPVRVTVDCLIAGVGDEKFRLVRVFDRRVLPSIGVLKLKVGPAAELTEAEAHAIVLADISIGSEARGVLDEHPFVVLLCDDVDHAGHRIAPVKRRRGAADDLHPLDVVRIDERELILPADIAVNTFPVDQDQDVVIAQAIHLDMAAHVILSEGEGGGQSR